MLEVVLDTSILARGLRTSPNTAVGYIMDSWAGGRFRLVLSHYILDELQRTLSKPYFQRNVPAQLIERYPSVLRQNAILSPITASIPDIALGRGDNMVLATADSASASYLVTGDHRLHEVGSYRGIEIIDPGTFAGILRTLQTPR